MRNWGAQLHVIHPTIRRPYAANGNWPSDAGTIATTHIRYRPPDGYNAYNRYTLTATLLLLDEIGKKAWKGAGGDASTWEQVAVRRVGLVQFFDIHVSKPMDVKAENLDLHPFMDPTIRTFVRYG
jgi:hypothetical protein